MELEPKLRKQPKMRANTHISIKHYDLKMKNNIPYNRALELGIDIMSGVKTKEHIIVENKTTDDNNYMELEVKYDNYKKRAVKIILGLQNDIQKLKK